MLEWHLDNRPPTLYTRGYVACMWRARDKTAFEGAVHTLEAAVDRQHQGDAPPTPWTRATRRVRTTRREGMTVWVITPRRRSRRPAARILYLHGGGFVHPLTRDYWRLARALSHSPAEVVVPAYPLAPQATVDDVLPRLVALSKDLMQQDPQLPLIVMGDSAGGGLTLSISTVLRDHGDPLPAHLVCLSPWLDVTMGDRDVATLESSDPMLAESGLRAAGKAWAGPRSPLDPLVSPSEGDLNGLPPIDVFIGDHDILRPAIDGWAEQAREADTQVTVHEVQAMFHVWMTRALPEARRTRRQLKRLVAHVAHVAAAANR